MRDSLARVLAHEAVKVSRGHQG